MQTPLIGSKPGPAVPAMNIAGAWRALSWFGFVLAFVGLTDVALVFYPARLGDPGWEFGVLATAVSTLPLLVVGFAAILSSAIAQQKRWQARLAAGLGICLGLCILVAFMVYLTTVPIALKMAPAEILSGIHKSILRTSVMATAFSITFIAGGILALRSVRAPRTAR